MTQHAVARAKERYGIELSLNDIHALEARIRRGEGVTTAKRPNGSRKVAIRCQGMILKAMVTSEGIITTFPPTGMNQLDKNGGRSRDQYYNQGNGRRRKKKNGGKKRDFK